MPRGLLKRTRDLWDSWWQTPMTHEWTAAERQDLTMVIRYHDSVERGLDAGESVDRSMTELRQLKDRFGLTEKGRRDLRWQLPREAQEPAAEVVERIPARESPDPRLRQRIDPDTQLVVPER